MRRWSAPELDLLRRRWRPAVRAALAVAAGCALAAGGLAILVVQQRHAYWNQARMDAMAEAAKSSASGAEPPTSDPNTAATASMARALQPHWNYRLIEMERCLPASWAVARMTLTEGGRTAVLTVDANSVQPGLAFLECVADAGPGEWHLDEVREASTAESGYRWTLAWRYRRR